MLANFASTYFLATPLGIDLSSSDAMAGEMVDPKVDSTPVDIKYEDIPEETLQAIRGCVPEGTGGGQEEIACMLWEDLARHVREGEVRHAHIRAATAEPIFYGYSY